MLYYDKEILTLRKLLLKPYVNDSSTKEKVLFYLPGTYYFTDSMLPLIDRYIQSEKKVIIVFQSIESMIDHGYNNVKKMIKIVEKVESMGVGCFDVRVQELYDDEYAICFCCSEYSDMIPINLRKASRLVVSIQLTGIYNHVYLYGRFEEIFSEQKMENIDYLVLTEYVADWLNERNEHWDKRILRFGYPKVDTLYHDVMNGFNIPEEWKQRSEGKKVFLFMMFVAEMEQMPLEIFVEEKSNKLAIWRPHPIIMDDPQKRNKIEEISKKYNIIVDDEIACNAAFGISDAMIVTVHSFDMVNYLYTGKPLCIYDKGETYGLSSYREEKWYKSAYNALEGKDVESFIKMVDCEENLRKKEQELYRKHIVKHFDGEVCNRIYNFFNALS